MKFFLYALPFLLSATNLFAQTLNTNLSPQKNPTDSVGFHLNGSRIHLSCSAQGPKQSYNMHDAKEIKLIVAGTMGDWCDPNGAIIHNPVPDTSEILSVRGHGRDFYIDGIKVRESSSLTGTIVKDVTVITGGIPVIYNDDIIRECELILPKRKIPVPEKEQKLATE